MSWCEAQPNVEYVSLSQQRAPANLTWGLEQRAKVVYEQQKSLSAHCHEWLPPRVPWRNSMSWCPCRSGISRPSHRRFSELFPSPATTHDAAGAHRHFVVTSFSTQSMSPANSMLSPCPRGEMENALRNISSICSVTAPPPMSLRAIAPACGLLCLCSAIASTALFQLKRS